jgi:hypothetical protein
MDYFCDKDYLIVRNDLPAPHDREPPPVISGWTAMVVLALIDILIIAVILRIIL